MEPVALEPQTDALTEATDTQHADPAEGVVAKVLGQPVFQLPQDLYIPPDALEVVLEAFEGPLDLLLYLIRRQNLDILDVPIAEITHQYMHYIELMKHARLELAGEYLVMAAILAEIKSRMLLPRPVTAEAEEEDPRAELIKRLQAYEQFKDAAVRLNELTWMGRDVFQAIVEPPEWERTAKPQPKVELQSLLYAYLDAMKRADQLAHHHIRREPLSVRERMTQILDRVAEGTRLTFTDCFSKGEGRRGIVVALMAILELIKESLIEIVQAEAFAPIYLQAKGVSM